MRFALTSFAVLLCFVVAALAADDKCKFTDFKKNQELTPGTQMEWSWSCKNPGKGAKVNIEMGQGNGPENYVYTDTIALADATDELLTFKLKSYEPGEYIARMITTEKDEKLPVEKAKRENLSWVYSQTFEIKGKSSDNSTQGKTADGQSDNTTTNNGRAKGNGTAGKDSAATVRTTAFGSVLLLAAGVLAAVLVL